ncbi:MAG: hypothetical protein IJ640_06275 [Prevotella sp.]|nr:hypothetical protein [Prevotella sp.]
MEKHVIFREDKTKSGVYLFVKKFQPKKWFRREKIEYCISADQAETFEPSVMAKVCDRIKREHPNAEIICEDYRTFTEKMVNHRFWIIGRWRDDGTEEFYSGNDQNNKPEYTTDFNEARFSLAESSTNETLQTIRKSTRDRVYSRLAFLSLENELLSPCMMITCTSKGNEQTKYFSKLDGNRLRLVRTSGAATKFNYESAIQMWEFLKTHNKNFLYAVLPVFKDNVNCKNIEHYMRENKVSRMVVMDLQLKHINR